jgi:large subunit ribosomal protein L20
MPRVKKGAARAQKHKKILKSTRGHIGAGSRRYRVAREAWLRAGQHATIGRKLKKRDFRRLWITRISAACRQRKISYSRFMHLMAEKGLVVNRKMLADLAVSDPGAFDRLVAVATGQETPEAAPAPKAEKAEPQAKAEVQPVEEAKTPAPERKKAPAKKKAAKPAAKRAAKKPAAARKPARKPKSE